MKSRLVIHLFFYHLLYVLSSMFFQSTFQPWPLPWHSSPQAHGAPLPEDEISASKTKLGLPDHKFYFPVEVKTHFQTRFKNLSDISGKWKILCEGLRSSNSIGHLISSCIDENLPNTK